MIINLAWPRAAVYGSDHWYYQWGGVVFTTVIVLVGALYYVLRQHDRAAESAIEAEVAAEA